MPKGRTSNVDFPVPRQGAHPASRTSFEVGPGASKRNLTRVQYLVEVYKYLKLIGYDYDNSGNLYPNVEKHKRWDRDNFSIYVRSAAKLLRAFDGNADKAKVYLVAKAHEYKEKDISDWTLNAVAKCAVDFTNKGDNVNDAGRDDSALDRRLGRRDNMVKVAFDGSNGNDIPGTRTIAHEGTGEGSEEVIYSVELPR